MVGRRLNIPMTDNMSAQIENIRDKTDASTDTEVVKKAIRIYDLLVRELHNGKEIIIKDNINGNEKILAFL